MRKDEFIMQFYICVQVSDSVGSSGVDHPHSVRNLMSHCGGNKAARASRRGQKVTRLSGKSLKIWTWILTALIPAFFTSSLVSASNMAKDKSFEKCLVRFVLGSDQQHSALYTLLLEIKCICYRRVCAAWWNKTQKCGRACYAVQLRTSQREAESLFHRISFLEKHKCRKVWKKTSVRARVHLYMEKAKKVLSIYSYLV